MNDIEKARQLFQEAGLAFPAIPPVLEARLKEQDTWLFSTRKIEISPYDLQHYADEADGPRGEDYAVLAHTGHGINSHAVQYYLVHGPLRMFLHLGWGGVYMDADEGAATIRECFSLADKIVSAVTPLESLGAGGRLKIVGSDFYGSHWSAPGQFHREAGGSVPGPADVLAEALQWLKNFPSSTTGSNRG